MVDYFVELTDVPRDINTQEIKQIFHNALRHSTVDAAAQSNASTVDNDNDEDDTENDDELLRTNAKPQQMKETFSMGRFVLDPVATDFIGKILIFGL